MIAANTGALMHRFAHQMVAIRTFEEALDRLFESGEVFGTYHRCIGQEATAVAVCAALDPAGDVVVSNHRNHGHYLAFSNDYAGLLAELKGDETGTTGGRGGSQVIFGSNFISNGILGSTSAVAAGIALSMKLDDSGDIVCCFLGDGALCEGVVHEALNMAALWRLPLLFVVEANGIAQTAPSASILAGPIAARFTGLGIETVTLVSTDAMEIFGATVPLVERARSGGGPCALIVEAARLCAHSKGDDDRPAEVLAQLRQRDPLRVIASKVRNFDEIQAAAIRDMRAILQLGTQ